MQVSLLNNIFRQSQFVLANANREFDVLLTDSRRLSYPERTIFFAITTRRNSGFRYIDGLYDKGVRNFVVSNTISDDERDSLRRLDKANIWFVPDVVRALQQLATYHRMQYDMPVVGITGSNGKTIVKDWLAQMLAEDRQVVASPNSYNSQIGVPLSVWRMSAQDDIALFEAGISESGEMGRLAEVIRPTIGIFTNIGQAHDENFLSPHHKICEKLNLFVHCDTLVYCSDHRNIHTALLELDAMKGVRRFAWGSGNNVDVRLVERKVGDSSTMLHVAYGEDESDIVIPFVDRASSENVMHCVAVMLLLGYSLATIADRCARLAPLSMRLEMNEGVSGSLLINDGYSLDLNSLSIALEVMQQQRRFRRKVVVLSDFVQSGMAEQQLYTRVAELLHQRDISCFIGIGPALVRNQQLFSDMETFFYPSVDAFLHQHPLSSFSNDAILLKGARKFCFENIAKVLQRKTHETIMEVNLNALISNLNFFRSRIRPTTRLMAMVKAASYGAGKVEIASALQFNNVDYLTVAYCDEGVDLRHGGISLPIMLMNPEEESFEDIIRYNLEPDIYSFRILELFSSVAKIFCTEGQKVPIHIEFDTGMHRLGFGEADISELAARLSDPDSCLEVKSVFSHLACSEDPAMDDFTRLQIDRFRQWSAQLKHAMHRDDIWCHILNSSGITRFPEAQMDMVRLGIGLYGIDPNPDIQRYLTPVSRLKSRISQVKDIPEGDSVGYNRRWVAQRPSRIAIVPIGYADGLNRHLGYENASLIIGGQRAPIVGSICMDMCFVDVTDVSCKEGDEVVIFGDAQTLTSIASAAGTIPYEILTSVSPRVKRVYFQE
ncbi:MAG: bifunctional UDP-N-acetylmuramoyl-tripeptide:D-alanyl-D-alanine ligase/alanine racemase [Bacteroidales bacterium]|nr:bifunctional UDP-N-acetylmuramoyl-tripeptide:D-alanyl-D-alanine ligase/alanine racemase [Bacteroidales bacterium]